MTNTNIDAFAGVAGTVTLFGETHDVLDLTAEEFKLEGRFANLDHAIDVVARLVPTAEKARLGSLTPKQIGAIYAVAMGVVRDVENEFPNASGPVPTETAPA